MKTLTGILIITIVLFSSCAKESEDILNNQLHTTPTEITEFDLPADAFDALQEVKREMAAETVPDRETFDHERNNCLTNFVQQGFYHYHQSYCGSYNYDYVTSYGRLYTGYKKTPVWGSSPTTYINGTPEVGFETATHSNQQKYYWFGVYDYAKGKYAYTKAGWGKISGKHTFDFTPNQWHNSRILVWAKNDTGNYGWRMVQGAWTMPFSN